MKLLINHNALWGIILAVFVVTSCEEKYNNLDSLVEKHGIEADIIVILNPNTRCSGCYDFGFTIGQYYFDNAIVVTTETIGDQYVGDNILILEKEIILKLTPKPYLSAIFSVSSKFDTIIIDPSQMGAIFKALEEAY